MIKFILNNKEVNTALPPGMPVLDFIRYHQHLTGTKIGCREGDCGACTILAGEIKNGQLVYRSATSCLMPLGNAAFKHLVTIEGVNVAGLNFIQQSFADEGATQCGFCTPGFIVSLAGFCLNEPISCSAGIDAVNGNICRCTGYKSIERAVATIADKLKERSDKNTIDFAIENNILPAYFATIKQRLMAYAVSPNGQYNPDGTALKFVGGGTDLYVQKPDEMEEAPLTFLLNKPVLQAISRQGNKCIMGHGVTVTDILESSIFQSYFPSLYKYLKLISSTQIRNMATIAGNLVNASPIGDFTVFFLALDAQLLLSDGKNKRSVDLRKFYKGYKSIDKEPEEFIGQLSFELPAGVFNFEKISKRTNLDIASVNSAIHVVTDGDIISSAGLSAGGVGPTPAYLSLSSDFLIGKKISVELITALTAIVQTEILPISDARGTATYKRLLLSQLIKAHFITLFPWLDVQKIMQVS